MHHMTFSCPSDHFYSADTHIYGYGRPRNILRISKNKQGLQMAFVLAET